MYIYTEKICGQWLFNIWYNTISNNALENFTNQMIYEKANSELRPIEFFTKDELIQYNFNKFNTVDDTNY